MIPEKHRLPPQGHPGVRRTRRAPYPLILLGAGVGLLMGCAHPDTVDRRAVARRQQAMEETPNPSKEVISGADLELMQQKTLGGHKY